MDLTTLLLLKTDEPAACRAHKLGSDLVNVYLAPR